MPASTQPIGILDSGIGGMTIANALTRELPRENIVYFGDTLHLPYGDKSAQAIKHYTKRIVAFLQEKGCKTVIIACNSASSTALEEARQELSKEILLVNVIDPIIHKVVHHDHLQKVGLIGTERTVRSGKYEEKIRQLNDSINIAALATPLLAPMIEAGFYNNTISQQVIRQYLNHEALQDIEALILACTHYPLIRPEIDEFFDGQIPIFDSTQVVTDYTRQLLEEHDLVNRTESASSRQFYVSDNSETFERTTRLFYDEPVQLQYCPLWEGTDEGSSNN